MRRIQIILVKTVIIMKLSDITNNGDEEGDNRESNTDIGDEET